MDTPILPEPVRCGRRSWLRDTPNRATETSPNWCGSSAAPC